MMFEMTLKRSIPIRTILFRTFWKLSKKFSSSYSSFRIHLKTSLKTFQMASKVFKWFKPVKKWSRFLMVKMKFHEKFNKKTFRTLRPFLKRSISTFLYIKIGLKSPLKKLEKLLSRSSKPFKNRLENKVERSAFWATFFWDLLKKVEDLWKGLNEYFPGSKNVCDTIKKVVSDFEQFLKTSFKKSKSLKN